MSNYYSKLVGRIVRDVEFIDDETVRIEFGNTMTESRREVQRQDQ